MDCFVAGRSPEVTTVPDEDVDLVNLVRGLTLTSKAAQVAMIAAVRRIEAEGIPGDIVECGVWRGGNIVLARKVAPSRTCWLYDTFNGMTEPGPLDVSHVGVSAPKKFKALRRTGDPWCSASLDEVKVAISESGVYDESRLHFIVGDINETLLVPENVPDQIALLRLDTDWHQSTKTELEVLYPRLAPGGVLIVDDYGHWKGAAKAVVDYFGGVEPNFEFADYTCGVFIKPTEGTSRDGERTGNDAGAANG